MRETAKYIYKAYRAAGMTAAGACAMIGAGIEPESAFIVNNVEDRMHSALGLTDEQYTLDVDSGVYTRFSTDAYGYGLHQWTYSARKAKLLSFARSKGKSIGDIDVQLDFALHELSSEGEYAALWKSLRTLTDVDRLSDMVTEIYERPANTAQQKLARRPLSRKWLAELSKTKVETKESEFWPPRTLDVGMSGADVSVWQALLTARGYTCPITGEFTEDTKVSTIAYQNDAELAADGLPGPNTWSMALRRDA